MEDLFIIKIGGETLSSKETLQNCLMAIAACGKKVILVHGGGKKVTELAQKLEIPQQMVEGRRITSAETLDLCTMVYAGLISKNIVAGLSAQNLKAIGLSGADLNCILSKKRDASVINYGFVGDIVRVDETVFESFIGQNIIPVVNSISISEDGELLNTNADVVAAEIAKAMSSAYKVHLIYCFEKNGVLKDITDENSVIPDISKAEFTQMKETKQIADGMIPKLQTAFRALYHGVEEARIIKSDALSSYFNDEKPGTNISLH
ncbi:acetylglutamate kinase [Chryseobacterium sp. 6424]|uniref:acetylglutamate kinase n=1 Tax=Chryseobacterium sp. 6424 TaxID=2039166 RepID=UPI000EFD4B98|nr:acetylglutamate kinase [Chryseobacterium sp. 6424]AYO57673.1 acetylglutamate kinase [Chryseobacterium sp. 6424]